MATTEMSFWHLEQAERWVWSTVSNFLSLEKAFRSAKHLHSFFHEELGREMGFEAEFNISLRFYEEPSQHASPFDDTFQGVGNSWFFQIDHFLHSAKFEKQICLHTDGKYHESDKIGGTWKTPTLKVGGKDEWKDNLIVKNGLRSIHADAKDTVNETLKTYLKKELRKAVLGKDDIHYIPP
jgi:hypothetical protein